MGGPTTALEELARVPLCSLARPLPDFAAIRATPEGGAIYGALLASFLESERRPTVSR